MYSIYKYAEFFELLSPQILACNFKETPRDMIFTEIIDSDYEIFKQRPYYLVEADGVILINIGFPQYNLLKTVMLGMWDSDTDLLVTAYTEEKARYKNLTWATLAKETDDTEALNKLVWLLIPDIIWAKQINNIK